MAEQFIAEIRARFPHGPYAIVGTCIGGLVAYEMAQRLAAHNETVSLVIVNSWHPSSYRSYTTEHPRRPPFLLGLLWLTWRTCGELWRKPIAEWGSILRRKSESLQSIVHGPTGAVLRRRISKRIEDGMFRAAAHYAIRPYPGRILNVVAANRVMEQDTRRVWRDLAGGGGETLEVATWRTEELVFSPHVEGTASSILRFISENSHDTPVRPIHRAAQWPSASLITQ
jgi:pimeloyl-ACP methyl ester carboxylesterase